MLKHQRRGSDEMDIKQFYSTDNMDNAILEALDWINLNKNRKARHITTHILNGVRFYVTVWYH
jgi:hypothetical protein